MSPIQSSVFFVMRNALRTLTVKSPISKAVNASHKIQSTSASGTMGSKVPAISKS